MRLAIIGAAVVAQSSPDGMLQYGALGLCAVLVLADIQRQNKMGQRIDEKDKLLERRSEQITELSTRVLAALEEDARSRIRLAETLENRPCLAGSPSLEAEIHTKPPSVGGGDR